MKGEKEVSGRGKTGAKVLSWEESVSGQTGCSSEKEIRNQHMRWALVKDLVFTLRVMGCHWKVSNQGVTGLESTSAF